ncbi:TonB-dependent receptor [uncultured Helicobacter sp.]|uniref:TonB-dependent receptor plug domain-containing protein n=1 Tax=uncultured Helicobacter sp. TaxID=175537 RepID=UPI0026114949|nr:TonB-dependent receptor [uncultured Helicobacter sp.]
MIRSPIFPNISLCTTYLLLGVSGLFGEEVSSAKLSPLVSVAHPISNANISIIDDAFIANTQAQNLREIFNKNAEIQVGGSTQIAQKLYIRGFEDRMYRVRLDGITQSGNLFHHQGNLVLDPFLIKDIEIEKGLAKAEDGAGALAGGINITTKNAFDILQNRDYGAHFILSGQSNKGVNASLAAYGKFSKNLGLLAAYSFDNIPYYRDGNGDKVLSSKTQTQNASFTLTFLPAKNHSINVHYHFNHITSVAPYAANVITSTTPELFNNTLNAHNAALRYDYSANDSFMLSWNNYFSHKSLKLSPTDVNHSDITTTHDPEGAMDLSLMNLGSDLGFKHYFGALGHLFKYGLNYQLIATKAYDLDAHSLAHGNLGHELGAIYGGYIGASFNLLDSLSFDLGSRYDYFTYRDKFNATHYTQGFSPYASLLYVPIDDLSFKLTANYNTRGAIPLDASLLTNSHAYIHSLRPEGMYNAEFDIDYDNSVFSAYIGVYYQYLKNFINSYTNAGEEHNHNSNADDHNHEDMYRQNMANGIQFVGYEANVGLDFDFIDAHIGIAQHFPTYKNHFITDTFELGALSGRSYYLSVGLRPFSALPQFQMLYLGRFVESMSYQGYNLYYDTLESVSKKGYDVHNIYLTYDVKSYLSLRLAFLNITNKTYANPYSPLKELFARGSGTALYEPGFNVKAQIAFFF